MPQRYFVKNLNGIIEGQDAHHIIRVMRMRDHDEIIVCDKQTCVLATIEIKDEKVFYTEIKKLELKKQFNVTLIQGLPKKNKMEFVSKYATVFGVSQIYFCGMERSIVKLENETFKKQRLSTIAKEAAELAHRFDIPNIEMVSNIKNIDFSYFDQIIVCDEDEHMVHMKALNNLDIFKKYAVIIGPEGGISDQERIFFKSLDATFISLGQYILPTEAASLSILSFFMHQN
ncbi:MAG: RsmE family RNA methyltransferase [Acholeplasmataceae bacterium]